MTSRLPEALHVLPPRSATARYLGWLRPFVIEVIEEAVRGRSVRRNGAGGGGGGRWQSVCCDSPSWPIRSVVDFLPD